jgi:hypothetical protein
MDFEVSIEWGMVGEAHRKDDICQTEMLFLIEPQRS